MDQTLSDLIASSISFTEEEKKQLVENLPRFSDEDTKFLINVLAKEQQEMARIKAEYFKKEESIIVKYLKRILHLSKLHKLWNVKDSIRSLIKQEHHAQDEEEAEKLLQSL